VKNYSSHQKQFYNPVLTLLDAKGVVHGTAGPLKSFAKFLGIWDLFLDHFSKL